MATCIASDRATQTAWSATKASSRAAKAVTAALLASALLMPAVPARAEVTDVAGLDYVYPTGDSDASGTTVGICAVTGDVGDTIFVNLKAANGSYLAKYLPFTITDGNTATVDGNAVGMLEIDIKQLDPTATYTVEIFADRGGKDELYTGELSVVRGQFGEGTEAQPIAVRTIGAHDKDRGCPAPKQVARDAGDGTTQVFELASETPDANGVYQYTLAKSAPESVEAHVTFVDLATGTQLKQDAYTLKTGESKDVSIPGLLDIDGAYYHTLSVSGHVALAYPGTTEASVMCQKVQVPTIIVDGKEQSFAPYTATVTYIDASTGLPLASVAGIGDGDSTAGLVDTLIVDRPYTYVPPTFVYVTGEDGKVQAYEIVNRETSFLFSFPQEEKDVQVDYSPIAASETRSWVITLINGTVGTEESGRTLSSRTLTGKVGSTTTFTADNIEVDGVTYVPASIIEGGTTRLLGESASAEDRAVAHTYQEGTDAETLTVYYVPQGYVAPGDYEFTVNYVNVANNQVIGSETYTAAAGMRSDLEVQIPAQLASGGNQYVRLNGQSDILRHSYYSPERTYTIYFRNVNDDLSQAITVTETVTVYDEVVTYTGTTVTPSTTTTTAGSTTTASATTATPTTPATPVAPTTAPTAQPGTTATTLPSQTTQVSSPEGTTVTRPDGTSVTSERIGDTENPLAATPDGQQQGQQGQQQGQGTENNKTLGMSDGAVMGIIGAMSATVVGLLIALFGRKGHDGEDGQA